MNSGWQRSNLGDVLAVLRNGLNCKQDKSGRGQKISRIESISLGSFDFSRVGYADINDNDKSKFKLSKGDILFSHINSPIHVGKTAVFDVDEDVYHGVNLLLMRPTEAVSGAYLELYLKYLFVQGYWRSICKQSVNQASINQKDISRVSIIFPSDQEEQDRIVAILDEAFDAIATAKANTEKNLSNAGEVFNQQHDTIFADQAGGPDRLRLGELATFRNGVNFTKRSKGHAVQIIGVKDFQNHFWVPLDSLDTVTLDGDLSPIDTVSEGDILTVRSNGNAELLGRCMVVGNLTEPTTHSGFTIRISLDRARAAPTYVCHFLRSRAVRRKLIDGGNGLNIKSLNQGMLAEIAVPLPSLAAQHKIVAKIDALATATHRLASITTRKLAALDELKKSLLHQAFTGKLTAKDSDKQLEAVA